MQIWFKNTLNNEFVFVYIEVSILEKKKNCSSKSWALQNSSSRASSFLVTSLLSSNNKKLKMGWSKGAAENCHVMCQCI
jgi:hypothetical protein